MPRIIETTVYTIDELSDAAKENARIWYRQTRACTTTGTTSSTRTSRRSAGFIGVTLATTPVCLYGGGTRDKTAGVHFSGFSQPRRRRFLLRHGTATQRDLSKAIRAHAPKDDRVAPNRG